MGVNYEPARKRYRAAIQINGKRHQKRFLSPIAAEKWLESIANDHKILQEKETYINKYPNEQTLGWMVERYIERKASRYKTYRENGYAIFRQVQERHGYVLLDDIDSPYLTQYAYQRVNDDGVAPPTVRKELTAVRQVLEFAIAHFSWIPKCPWPIKPDVPPDERLDHERQGLKDQDPLEPEDAMKVIEWMKPRNLHSALAVILFYETSMRRSEVVKLRREWLQDIPVPLALIPAEEHKNKKPREIVFTPFAHWAIKEALKSPSPDGRVLVLTQKTDKSKGSNLLRLFKQGCTEVLGRPFLTLHKLRKVNVSLQRARKIPDDMRQRQSGHLSKKVMDRDYTTIKAEDRYEHYQESFLGVDSL